MLFKIPAIARMLGVFCLFLGLLGAQGRIRIAGEGIVRDREMFFGLLAHLRPASFVDIGILPVGIFIGVYLFFFSFSLRRLIRLDYSFWWLQLHVALTFLLVIVPFVFYQGWEPTTPDRPNYSERFLPTLDDLFGHTYNILLEVDFVSTTSYVYALLLNVLLSIWSFIWFVLFRKGKTSNSELVTEDHLLE